MDSDKELLLAVKEVVKLKHDLDEDGDSSHSLMHVRWITMDTYVSNLLYVLAMRASGKSLKNHPVINRLIECRIVLEKIRSLFKKQDKHISRLISVGKSVERGEELEDIEESKEFQPKLLDVDNIDSDFDSDSQPDDEEETMNLDDSATETMSHSEDDGLKGSDESSEDGKDEDDSDNDESESDDDSFEAKMKAIRSDDVDDEEIDSDEVDAQDEVPNTKETKKVSKVYRPPKINPVYFEDEGGSRKKKQKDDKQSKEVERRLLQEEKLARLQETGETPIEIKDYSSIAMKQKNKQREIQRYEEANMIRLNRDRRERRRHNQMDEVMDLMEGKQDYPEDASSRKKSKVKAKRLKGKFKKNNRKRR